MSPIMVEMPTVTKCTAVKCAYNSEQSCHAKAITIGDASHPDCDTYFTSLRRNREKKRVAGVGACKVGDCRFNEDLECTAESISVGPAIDRVKCLTFSERP